MTIENISNTEWGPLTLQTTIKTAVGISRGKIMVESGIGYLLRYLHTVHTSHFSSNVKNQLYEGHPHDDPSFNTLQ